MLSFAVFGLDDSLFVCFIWLDYAYCVCFDFCGWVLFVDLFNWFCGCLLACLLVLNCLYLKYVIWFDLILCFWFICCVYCVWLWSFLFDGCDWLLVSCGFCVVYFAYELFTWSFGILAEDGFIYIVEIVMLCLLVWLVLDCFLISLFVNLWFMLVYLGVYVSG